MAEKSQNKEPNPEAQLRSFIDRFEAKGQRLMRAVRATLRKRFPTANEVVYDYSHSVVVAYSPTDRGIDAIASLSLTADGLRLYLMHGPQLPDPKRLLQGTAKQVRFIPIEAARQVTDPDVEALIGAASDKAKVSFASRGRSLIIKSDGAKARRGRRSAK